MNLACQIIVLLAIGPLEVVPLDSPARSHAVKTGEHDWLIVNVVDGDTLDATRDDPKEGRHQTRFRLLDIDAPEREQRFGNRATEFNERMVLGRVCRIEEYGTEFRNCQLGRVYYTVDMRLLDGPGGEASAWERNEQCLNLQLVKHGLAWNYKDYSDSPEYAAAEIEARKNRRGMWGAHVTIEPPWEFRRAVRASKAASLFQSGDDD